MDQNAGQASQFDGGSIARRLLARRLEIQRSFTHTLALSGPVGLEFDGANLQDTVAELIGYAIACIANGEDESVLVPTAPLQLVRAAARNGVTLDSILVRLISAQALFNEYILDEMGNASGQDMRRVQSLQSSMLTTLTKRLSYEYREELGRKADTAERRRTLLIERLLAGVPIDRRELPYSFDGWHIALVATGRHAANTARLRAESLGTGYLTVIRGNGMVWAWIGSRHMVSVDRVRTALERSPDPKTRVALGEPGEGVDGWRSSHFEARAAHDVAIRLRQDITQFSTVALEAIALQVPDLARSLQAAYLGPLSQRGGGGLALRQTLRAYFAAGRNASSAASALRVTRRTVENRLRTVEAELGRPLNMCGAELEMALRLEDLREGEIPSTS